MMDNISNYFTGTKPKSGELGANTTVGLTGLGAAKVEQGSLQGQYYEIVANLKDEGASSLGEIARDTHIDIIKVKRLVKVMMLRGYLRKVGADES